jgi:2-polyprenyl-3-methyl-5-hydroxy-6-metoxy-1,4-benzoquinol methylase
VKADEAIATWSRPDAIDFIHPSRGISEAAYWASGKKQAELLAADIPAGVKVMDFGCGDGRVAIPLRALGYEVTAVDGSANMLDALAANDPDLTVFQSDGTDFGQHLGRRKMDAVYCLAVLIHLDYASAETLIRNLRAIVKKGGLLILDWPVADEPAEGVAWLDVTTWSQEQQDTLTAELGLTRVDDQAVPWQVYRA